MNNPNLSIAECGNPPVPPRSGVNAVTIRNVSFGYGNHRVLDDFSLDIHAGELLTVLGPSGSGKSTVLNLLVGVSTPDSGSITMAGRELTRVAIAKRNMGYVFQNYALFPHMSVWENVAFPLRVRKLAKGDIARRVTATLETVQLAGFAKRAVAALSGGQQQRVAFARAVVFRPDLVLLDEPLGALDRKLRHEMQYEVRSLQQRLGLTTIMVTHDQEEALSISDRIVVMRSGQIVQVGTPSEIYNRPATRFVAEFIGNANIVSAAKSPGVFGPMLASGGHKSSSDTFMVRPERSRITVGEGLLNGTITDISLTGPHFRFVIMLDGGGDFVVLGNQARHANAVGDRVGIEWDCEDMWPLHDDRLEELGNKA